MADIDISKIIIRRGPARDLPGQPISYDPPVWEAPLEEGELAFGSDEGRLFIGPSPQASDARSTRLTFPYQNIEILAENSTEGFAAAHGGRMREGTGRDYLSATLPVTGDTLWGAIMVNGTPYGLPRDRSATVIIEYMVRSSVRPIRQGRIDLGYRSATSPVIDMVDDFDMIRAPEIDPKAPNNSPQVLRQLRFRFSLNGAKLQFEYLNTGREALSIKFKVSIIG